MEMCRPQRSCLLWEPVAGLTKYVQHVNVVPDTLDLSADMLVRHALCRSNALMLKGSKAAANKEGEANHLGVWPIPNAHKAINLKAVSYPYKQM